MRNPANGQVVGRVNWTDPSDIPGIVAQLAKAQPSWERLGPEGRGQVLARFAQWLIDNTGRIEAQLIAETGKSKIDGGIEIPRYSRSSRITRPRPRSSWRRSRGPRPRLP